MLSRSLALAVISWVLLLPRDCRRLSAQVRQRVWPGVAWISPPPDGCPVVREVGTPKGSISEAGWVPSLVGEAWQEQSAALWQSVYPLVFPGKSVWWISPGEGRPDQSIGDVSTFGVDLLPS